MPTDDHDFREWKDQLVEYADSMDQRHRIDNFSDNELYRFFEDEPDDAEAAFSRIMDATGW